MDLFERLPIDVFHKILSSITISSKEEKPTIRSPSLSSMRFTESKEAVKTCILSKSFLQAFSTLPDLNFYDDTLTDNKNHGDRVANYLHRTLTRYQLHNIPIRTLRLTICISKDHKFANFLHHWIRDSDEYQVNEIHLELDFIPPTNLLQSIFSFKKLVSLRIFSCDFLHSHYLINCSSLRTLQLWNVYIDQWLLERLFQSCPLIEGLQFIHCRRISAIRVANLPNLKWLEVYGEKNQTLDVNVPSLELINYGESNEPVRAPSCLLSIQSTQNLKGLKLYDSAITEGQFHNLIASSPVLEELILDKCFHLNNIKVSSHSLTFLSLQSCGGLMEVTIDAPILTEFEYVTTNSLPSLVFTNGSRKRNCSLNLSLDDDLEQESSFLKLIEFLMAFKSSDNISLSSMGISFDKDIINNLRDYNPNTSFQSWSNYLIQVKSSNA